MLELLGKKIGMTHVYKNNGSAVALTMIKIHDAIVVEVHAGENKNKITIGFEKQDNIKKINKSLVGFYNKKKISVHKSLKVSNVKTLLEFKEGDFVDISKIIKEGDKISVRGKTTGKGFAGVMKRWNFRGLEASHGVSISHRSHGSTGQRQDPGKTFKGKKMAGHMGSDNTTVKNIAVDYLDINNSVVGLRGCVPGKNGSDVIIKINNT
ncbi:MAG: 50S ribosomal protein L3 [Alphaproteobacteria bacterium]|nr:50S ribosomal protein L3 [Alphaproteobacteria bacterium]